MPKKIKLNLNELNVTSFQTAEAKDQLLKGGISGTSILEIYCDTRMRDCYTINELCNTEDGCN